MKIIGISAFYHDSSASIIVNGKLVAATQEERFSRIKNDSSFPIKSIKFCLSESNLKLEEIDYFIFYEKPFLKFERLIENYLSVAPHGLKVFIKTLPVWIKNKFFQKNIIIRNLEKIHKLRNLKNKIFFAEHHESHAASAFFPSEFEESAILTLDGVGEYTTTSIGIGKKNSIKILKELHFPHSIGLLYSSFTHFLGFKVNSAEYKVMGLAPYGKPIYSDIILNELIDLKDDGSFRINKKYFGYINSFNMTNKKFENLFKIKTRIDGEKLTSEHMNIAASIQDATNKIVLKIVKYAKEITKQNNLVIAGGVALNCVTNGHIFRSKIFDKVWAQPASGDAGGSLGAALLLYFKYLNNKRILQSHLEFLNNSYLGPSFSNQEIKNILDKKSINFKYLNNSELINETVDLIINQKIVGWFNGKMEFGPRSLGNRSILCDPRSEKMQSDLNKKIKFREGFRPFAPSIIEGEFQNWFEKAPNDPYMLFVTSVKKNKLIKFNSKLGGFDLLKLKRSQIPSVTHVDNTSRYQVVFKKTNEKFYNLINNFYKKTNCPILVNTSFNVRGEPIVCSPIDALNCFFGTNLDFLVLENFLISKKDNLKLIDLKYSKKFDLD